MKLRSRVWAAACVFAAACGAPARSVRWERRAVVQGIDIDAVHAQLREAAHVVRDELARDGDQGLLRLRLRPAEVSELFTPNAVQRLALAPTGFEPSPAERRWTMLAALAHTPVVGFCARGVRMASPSGEDGFVRGALVVDRMLIVGREPGGLWGVWIEGLVRMPTGWRLLPSITYEAQVDTPRRDHTDIALWDCDVAERPQ